MRPLMVVIVLAAASTLASLCVDLVHRRREYGLLRGAGVEVDEDDLPLED